MSLERNKVLVQRYYQSLKNFGKDCEDLFDKEKFVSRFRSDPKMDFDTYKKNILIFSTAFPDLTFEPLDITAEEDRVVVYLIATGHHQGLIMGIPPTGNKISIFAFHQFKIADGKILEHNTIGDLFSLANQVGAIDMSTKL